MKEILITSSILIAVLLLVRWLFRGKVSQKLIYAAWMLVALRLLVPVQLGQLDFSLLTAAKPVTQVVEQVTDKQIAGVTQQEAFREVLKDYVENDRTVFTPHVQESIQIFIENKEPVEQIVENLDKTVPEQELFRPEVLPQVQQKVEDTTDPITLGQIVTSLWLAGVVGMAVWFLTVNVIFLRRAKKDAVQVENGGGRVRVSPNVPTPCLVGFFRPVIYLTPASVENEQMKNHVLTHELTHLHHFDHIWAVVRCVCLCIYWFDPLVWIAAHQSRRDCELACDESALKKLGDDERVAYGKTLLDVVTQSMSPTHLIETATAMNETKKQLKERVSYIVKKPRNFLIAAICMVLVAAITAGCAFAGSNDTKPVQTPTTETTQPTSPQKPDNPDQPNDPDKPDDPAVPDPPPEQMDVSKLFDGEDNWYRRALTSNYFDPADADIAKFFACGFADESNAPTDAEWEFLKDVPGFEKNERFRRLPVVRMDEVLMQVFGLKLSDMNGVGLRKLTYLESTDCYYFMAKADQTEPKYHFEAVTMGTNYYTADGKESFVYIAMKRLEGTLGYYIEQNKINFANKIIQTTELARQYLNMNRLEFAYTSAHFVREHMQANGFDQQTCQRIYLHAHAAANRSLYLDDDGTLMMYFFYDRMTSKDDPLHAGFYVPVDIDQLVGFADGKQYQWLFEMLYYSDGYVADAYGAFLTECFLAEPEQFLINLSKYDEKEIRLICSLMYYGIMAQEEYDQFKIVLGVLTEAVDSAGWANAETISCLEILGEVPEWFPYK